MVKIIYNVKMTITFLYHVPAIHAVTPKGI